MQIPDGLRAFRHRDYRIFWGGQVVSLVGTWMQIVGQSWLVLQLTNSPFRLGLIATLQFTPLLLFSLVAGAVADRLPKRRLILTTQTILMLQAFTLATLVWTGHIRYWHLVVLATLLGTVQTLDIPARQSFIVEMVGKEDLMNAITLNSAAFNGARIIGPAVAGLLVAQFGVAPAYLLNGFSFLAVIGALLGVRAEGRPRPRARAAVWHDIREGLQYALRTPLTGFLLSLLAAVSIFAINHNVLVPLLARNVLHQEAGGFGLLMSSLGGGALVGAFTMALLRWSRPPLGAMTSTAVVLCGAVLAMSVTRSYALAVVVLLVSGFAQIIFTASCNTTLQVTVPDELRGRVMSLYAMVWAGVSPIGAFMTGSVAEAFGPSPAYLINGILGMGLVMLLIALAVPRLRRTGGAAAGTRPA